MVRLVIALLVTVGLTQLVACSSDEDAVLVIGGTPVAEATLVASFRDLAEQRPEACELFRGLGNSDAYQALVDLIAENLGVEGETVPPGGDVDRAGELLIDECEKLAER